MIDELDMDDALRTHFKALHSQDPAANLRERLAFFQDYNPEFAQARFGFVPMVAEHGWAVWTAHDVDFIYTLGLAYTYARPDVMLVMPGSTIEARNHSIRQVLASLMVDVPADATVPPTTLDVEELGIMKLREYDATTDFAARPNGLLHSFMRFFADIDTEAIPPRMWIVEAPQRKGLMGRLFGG